MNWSEHTLAATNKRSCNTHADIHSYTPFSHRHTFAVCDVQTCQMTNQFISIFSKRMQQSKGLLNGDNAIAEKTVLMSQSYLPIHILFIWLCVYACLSSCIHPLMQPRLNACIYKALSQHQCASSMSPWEYAEHIQMQTYILHELMSTMQQPGNLEISNSARKAAYTYVRVCTCWVLSLTEIVKRETLIIAPQLAANV